jgi:fibro-slime domain-containing protein
VIVEVSLNETKEVLAGFAEVLEETIAAKPLAALEITPRHFAAAGSADVSSALFSKQSAGLGDALKSAFSSVSAAEVYGADGYEENIAGIEHFPVNLYDYMGTLANIGSQSPNPRPGNNRFNTQYHNFNTPAMLMFGNANSYSTTTNYTYGSYSIKSYFLFNQPQVVYSNGNTWTNFNNNASDNSGNNAGNRHGNQNRVEASDFSAGITQDIAKSKLNNGAFEINFATMNGLGLFPEIKTEPQGFNPVYIYGKSDGTADQKAIGDQFSAKKSNGDPGMIQAYPNRGLPFVKDSDGYYSFDSARERVYLQTGSKRLGRTAAADNGFFPFNANGVAANTNSESYNFGMSMNIDFVMPKDGKVTGNDMVFEFVGDDDLWVYIDGQLVLDLGGIHGAESGTINFNKKTVTTLNNAHTIRTLTPGAPYTGASTSVTGPDTKNFSAINSAFANSFNDYSMHTLQLFYMERNPTGSNCKITFNLQSIEPDKLNVFKYADENTSDTEKFGFDVYVSESKTKPGNTEGTLLAETSDANIITQNVKYVNDDLKALALTKDDRFALDIPDKYKWVRVVERPKLTDGETGEERFSTVFLGNGINESGKDSGWMSINKEGEVKTNALFCFNYAQHPITLTKFRLDGATWDTKGTTETNDDIIKYYEMETVTFNLYEVEADGKTPKTDPVENGVVTTDDKGQITLNKPGDNTTPKLKPNTKYVLVEQNTDATKNYERTPIYFETTQGVSALVKKIWYYDAAGNEVNYSGKLDETGYGQIVFADATGRHIELYNKRLTGSVRVEKTLKDIQNVNFDAQGDPIFLFKLEKLEKLDSGEYKVIGTQSTSVRFGSEYTLNADETSATMPSTFDNLEAGYYYRISELDTMRYDLVQNGVKLTIGGTEQSGGTGNSTPVFELTDTIITNQTEITASFANTRTYPDYLSDTDVAVNTFTYTPPWPAPSAPVVYEVHIYKSNNNTNEPTVKKFVTQGDLIDISNSSNGIGIYMGTPDTDGAIGRSGNRNNGAKFYPYTPITSGLITDNSNIVKLYLN